MRIEVITTTMSKSPAKLLESMNIKTDIVIANQSEEFKYEEEKLKNGCIAKIITTNTIGASLNRNIGIAYSSGDILIITDDDTVFVDDYEEIVKREFGRHPNADAIKFFCGTTNGKEELSFKKAEKFHRAKMVSIMSAGIHCFAVKREFVVNKDISFPNNLGPGKRHNHGEDGIFFKRIYRNKGKVCISPEKIGDIDIDGNSTWFEGYNYDYFVTNGYIYSKLYGFGAPIAIIRRALRSRNKTDLNISDMIKAMLDGVAEERR